MNAKRLMTCALLLMASLSAMWTASGAPTATVINLDEQYQTITDFGASDCWAGDYVGRYFSAAMRERAAKLLFSKEFNRGGNPEGIGLSSWRVNLGAGSAEQGSASGIDDATRRAECFLTADGVTYDWSKAAGQQRFMQMAREYGVENFVFFSNSAPVYYTLNGLALRTGTNWGANLRDDAYDDFADYLATVAKHFADLGYHIAYISPVNEPQYDWTSGQEGSPWHNHEVSRLVRELDASLTSRGLDTRILIPEAGAWYYLILANPLYNSRGYDQIEQFFNPANASTYVGDLPHMAHAVAGHSYWTFTSNALLQTTRTMVAEAAAKRGLQVFQTEWSMLDSAPESSTGYPAGGYDNATYMDNALYLAKVIYCDLVLAGVTSWSYWTAMAQEQWGHRNRFYLLRLVAAGDAGPESYGDLRGGGTVYDNRNLWALGNYSRFIRPGYKRVGMSGADDLSGLMGSAYVSPDGAELVAVYVNMAQEATTVTVETAGNGAPGIATIKKYTTSESNALTLDHQLPLIYSGGEIEVPARSVVTLVMQLDATHLPAGDVDGNGLVDIDDVNALINIILGKAGAGDYAGVADVDGSGLVDVDDVNAVVKIILAN